ncbi:hypothetical protein chiPu_0002867 [Chiloscyllium punctatum]|uniref:Uncharacterized protein n=1 Tax=Chiloscyllium punctatum TaxID=137246 RepID=A0A401S282_CHIPU|nr:hypothetical protein [Chiloscyllium punctatum]
MRTVYPRHHLYNLLKPENLRKTNWTYVTACCQKPTEVTKYEERFRMTWKEYVGVPDVQDVRKFEGCDYGLLKSAFVAELKPELTKMLKLTKPDWDQRGTNYYDLVDRAHQLDRDIGSKLQIL